MSNVYGPRRAQAHLIGARVSGLIRERRVSMASLAASIPLQRSTLENYCAGRPIPTDTLATIARKLDTTVTYLTAVSDDPGPAVVDA